MNIDVVCLENKTEEKITNITSCYYGNCFRNILF